MSEPGEPLIDPDSGVGPEPRRWRGSSRRSPSRSVLAAIAAGGVLGALARDGLQRAYPHPAAGFAWATFGINVSGCLLIGGLMTLLTGAWAAPRLLRPFLGIGVLGGYTTFSTYVVDIQQAVAAGARVTALAYLFATLAGAMAAVWVGAAATGRLVRSGRPAHRSDRGGWSS